MTNDLGAYYLYPIFDSGGGVLNSWVTRRTPVDVIDRDVEGLPIVLEPQPVVRGRVVVQGDAADIDWSTVRIALRARHPLTSLVGGLGNPSWTIDPETLEFTIPNIPEARMAVLVQGLPPDAYVAGIQAGARSIDNDGTIEVVRGFDESLRVTIGRQGGTVQGTVRDRRQSAVSRAGVVLVPAPPRRDNAQLYKRTEADDQGAFFFTGVAPGEYKVFAWPELPEGQAEADPAFLAPYESRGQTARVTGGTSVIDVEVIE